MAAKVKICCARIIRLVICLLSIGNRIVTTGVKRMAFTNPSSRKHPSFYHPMLLNRFQRIGGAGRIKAAGWRLERRYEFAVRLNRLLGNPSHPVCPLSSSLPLIIPFWKGESNHAMPLSALNCSPAVSPRSSLQTSARRTRSARCQSIR